MNVRIHKLLSLILAIAMVVGMLPAAIAAEGTADLTINTVEGLQAFVEAVNGGNTYEGKTVTLAADLNLTDIEWTPIGNGTRSGTSYSGKAFKGTFDGGDYTISGLTITTTTDKNAAVGLFGVVDGGTVKNLNLTGVNVAVSNSNLMGAAIGMMLNDATAEKITVSGAVTGYDGVGGIVGRLIISGTIKDCTNNASVTSTYGGIGGIVGKAYYEDGSNTALFANITNCTNNGTVNAPMYVGGIVGLARANVSNCVNNGKVVGGTQTGGIIGQLIAAGTVAGNENKAKISGKNHLGGIIGDYSQSNAYTYYNVTIANNTNRGELAATEQCAAILGCNNIDGFSDMTASGNVSYYNAEGLELFGNPEDMVIDGTNEFAPVEVATFAELQAALANGGKIKLTDDITTTAALTTAGVTATIDLNDKTLTIGAGDNKFNDESNITIENGKIVITGLTVSGNAIFCLDEYETSLKTVMTLNDVDLVGEGYSSAYGIFYIGKSSELNVNGGEWNLSNDTFTAGGVFKADASTATLNISGLELTAHNVRRVVTYAATTIEDSTMTITGDADGVDAEMEHGFNRSPLTIKNSTVTMKDMVGRGITAENGAVSIENSTVTMTNVQEATIDVRGGQTLTVDAASTVTVDKAPTGSGTIIGTVTVKTTPTSTLTNCYTSDSGYWGECGGNAKESFVFKFYNDDTYMGYTSLNNVGGIIDGDVYVSWSIKLDAASNTDEYWTMAWEIQPTLAMQPTRVEHWVDGVKAAEAVVEPNWSDRIFPVVAAVTDADGKILSYVNNHDGHTLQAALNSGGNITLLADVTLTEGLTVPAGVTVTLDLNGKTISQTKAQTEAYAMISNKGTLTIQDSVGSGKISYADTTEYTADNNYASNTIRNEGVLNVTGGTIENTSSENVKTYGYPHAIDVYQGSTTNISGGTVKSINYDAIRMFCNSATVATTVNISGGTIVNRVTFQHPSTSIAAKGVLNITGGTFESTTGKANVRLLAFGNDYTNMDASISGGSFDQGVAVSDYTDADVTWKPISGGTFATDMSDYCVDGFTCEENADGTYGVVEAKTYVAQIGETKYTDLHEAMVACKDGETVLLINDVNLVGTEWEPVSFKGTFDGQNHTISNLTINKPGVSNTGFITSLNGTFKDVTFTNPTVTGGENTGVVAGRAGGGAALAENITVNGTIKVETTHSGYARAAAIVGGWAYGNYKNITVDGGDKAVSYIKHTGGGDGRYVAGIVGHADDVESYVNCTVKNITISGGWLCGGIAGPGPSDGLATGCAVENIDMGADYSGGMFGWYYGDGTIEDSTVKDVAFTDGTTNNGAIGGYGANDSANVVNVTIENVTNGGAALLEHVAEINDTYYINLQAAINAAQSGETITLLRDVEVTEKFNLTGVNLDLNEKTLFLKTTGNYIVDTVTISNGTIDVTGNSVNGNTFFTVGGQWAKAGSELNLDEVNLIGDGYHTDWAVICVHNGTSLNMTDSTVDLKSDNGTAGGFIKDTSGNNNTAVVTIKDTELTLTNVDRGFTGAKVNLDTVTLTITGGEHGINGSELSIKNSTVSISDGTGRAITLNKFDASIMNSSVTINNMGEGEIRFKTANALTVDDASTLSESSAHADVVGATINGKAVTGTEDNMSTVTVGQGVTTVVNPVSFEGEGTAESPYLIANVNDLETFRDSVNAGNSYDDEYFKLTADIDLATSPVMLMSTEVTPNWTPIGTKENPFKGTFDGNGETISNMIVVGEANQGFFGYADLATIKNLTIENATVIGTDCVGGIAGQVYSSSLIDNCHVSGLIQIEGQTNVGGIVGKYYTKVTNSSVIGDGTGTSYVKGVYVASDYEGDNIGGIMGHGGENNTFTNNTVKNITVSGTRKVGGIVGMTDQNTDVTGCVVENVVIETTATTDYANSKITTMSIGGLIGQHGQKGSASVNGTVIGNTVKNVTFNNANGVTVDVGPIVGGARGGSTGMLAPDAGVTAKDNAIYMSTITGSTNMYLMVAVAKIGETNYYTLQDAIDAIETEGTITLIADVMQAADTQVVIPAGKTITLVMNGKTYTGRNYNFSTSAEGGLIANNGTLTVIGDANSVLSGHGIANGFGVIFNNGTLTLNGGKYINTNWDGTNGDYPDYPIRNCGTLIVNEGAEIQGAWGCISNNGGTATINGGTFTVTGEIGGHCLYNFNNGSVVIKGGDFNPYNTTGTSVTSYSVYVGSGEVAISGGSFEADVYGRALGAADGVDLTVTGGTFTSSEGYLQSNLVAFLADGYAALPSLQETYVVGTKPTATVNDLPAMVIPAGDYGVWNGSSYTGTVPYDMPLNFVKQFLADQTEADMATSPYADWYGDFVITFDDITNDSFVADGCYLAGYYGSFGWVKIPVDGMTIEDGVRYPVMLGVGLGQKYDYICAGVKDFKCALFITPEILAANPNMTVNLELAVVDNSKGQDAAASALIDNENVYRVTNSTYEAEEFTFDYVARIGTVPYKTLEEAIEAVEAEGTIVLMADNSETIVISKPVTIQRNGFKADKIFSATAISVPVNGYKLETTDTAYTVSYNTDVVAEINGVTYTDLTTALNAAAAPEAAGKTVKLVKDADQSMVIVSAGVTLDLNGKTLTVDTALLSNGNIVDSVTADTANELGAVVLGANAFKVFAPENTYLPIYDGAVNGYRLFAYKLNSSNPVMGNNNATLYYQITFTNANSVINKYAASLIAAAPEKVTFSVKLAWGDSDFTYNFKTATVQQHAAELAAGQNSVLRLTLSGLDSVPAGSVVTTTGVLTSETNVTYTANTVSLS